MPLVEVIYENGILRPLRPLDLAEGTRLEVTIIEIIAPPLLDNAHVDEAAYESFLDRMDSIAALPLQSVPQPHTARDHDTILYPKQGTIP
ncbi:MAG TPA: antitoxin family protein [Chloroflexia bacterium]|nr:antitoxin family protein [Chloroflexia bacterium]